MNKISLFGPGFVGGWLYKTFPDKYIIHPRGALLPTTNRIVWPISTVDNYNVQTNPHLDIDTNLSLLITELEECRRKFGKHFEFNFISSWFVYSKNIPLPAKEGYSCEPTGFYSITKRAAEQLLISYCEYYGIQWRILRLANVLGVGDKKVSKRKNAVQWMLRELVQGRSIDLYTGRISRDFIDVRDVVMAIDLLIEKSPANDIYNIGSGNEYRVIDVIEYVHKKTKNSQIKMIDVPQFHKQVQAENMYLDISKLMELGYEPQYSILHTLDWLMEHYKNE